MIDYYEYIHSAAWFNRTVNVRQRNRGRCECCCMRWGRVVHHRTYAHLGEELDEELVHLCLLCHNAAHGKPDARYYIWPSRLKFLEQLQSEMMEAGFYGNQ